MAHLVPQVVVAHVARVPRDLALRGLGAGGEQLLQGGAALGEVAHGVDDELALALQLVALGLPRRATLRVSSHSALYIFSMDTLHCETVRRHHRMAVMAPSSNGGDGGAGAWHMTARAAAHTWVMASPFKASSCARLSLSPFMSPRVR